MSTTAKLYQDMVSTLNHYETFCKKCDLVEYKIFKAQEDINEVYKSIRQHPVVDSIIRFLKTLKEYAVKLISSIFDYVSRILSYDAWISMRNLSKFKRIEKAFNKADAVTKNAINEKLAKIQMSSCWNFDNFRLMIKQFGDLCRFGTDKLAASLKNDVESIPTNQLSYIIKLQSMANDYTLAARWDINTNNFVLKEIIPLESGNTLSNLGISEINDLRTLMNSYEIELQNYKNLIKLPGSLRNINYSLDRTISNVSMDPTIAENIKDEQKYIRESILDGIKITKKYIDFVRSISTSINIKLSSILNKIRIILAEKDALYEKEEAKYSKEAFMTETTIVVTTDDEFNKRYQNLTKIMNVINEINSQQIYPEISVIQDNVSIKDFTGVHEFCKQQTTSTVIPLKIEIKETINNIEEIKSNFIADVNRCIADTEMCISINTENYFVVSILDNVPNMEYSLEKAEYYKLF